LHANVCKLADVPMSDNCTDKRSRLPFTYIIENK
jgi:hypothetical protein